MPIPVNPLPSVEMLHEYFRYDDVHGHLYWRPRFNAHPSFNTRFAMQRADTETPDGRYRVRFFFDGKSRTFQPHRIIWKMVYGFDPIPEVDHIDRDPSNNRLFNLRVATRGLNVRNRTVARRQDVGVYLMRSGKFRAQITSARKSIHLGTFATMEEAYAAFRAAHAT